MDQDTVNRGQSIYLVNILLGSSLRLFTDILHEALLSLVLLYETVIRITFAVLYLNSHH